ncbi:MAG: DUF1488 family protein [Burkholderiaceae bacterium]|jgi:hypothetical protein|nr:DUF1488 family protein [Burkholderiales bacterium]TAL71739.1 MAG: DUF1488 family protein [Burkholderiaceae bacterium]TBR73445.1 MAG: DUF1488 family protein [Burkholderiaceae bacterium]
MNMPRAHWVFDNRAVEFSIKADGHPVICWISWETLADHFGATRETAVDVLLANFDKIAPVAERVYRARSPDERLVVTTEDF